MGWEPFPRPPPAPNRQIHGLHGSSDSRHENGPNKGNSQLQRLWEAKSPSVTLRFVWSVASLISNLSCYFKKHTLKINAFPSNVRLFTCLYVSALCPRVLLNTYDLQRAWMPLANPRWPKR